MRELSTSDIREVSGGAAYDPLTSLFVLATSPITAIFLAWSSAGQLDYGEALGALWRLVLEK